MPPCELFCYQRIDAKTPRPRKGQVAAAPSLRVPTHSQSPPALPIRMTPP